MKLKLTNKDLKREYRRVNRKYFENSLPNDITIKFDTEGELDSETYGEYFAPDNLILIEEALKNFPDFAFIILRHEMAHVKHFQNGHGHLFSSVIADLFQQGAYDNLL